MFLRWSAIGRMRPDAADGNPRRFHNQLATIEIRRTVWVVAVHARKTNRPFVDPSHFPANSIEIPLDVSDLSISFEATNEAIGFHDDLEFRPRLGRAHFLAEPPGFVQLLRTEWFVCLRQMQPVFFRMEPLKATVEVEKRKCDGDERHHQRET